MEIQLYAEETMESISRSVNTRPNVVFALLFEEDASGSYFDEAITTKDKKDFFTEVLKS